MSVPSYLSLFPYHSHTTTNSLVNNNIYNINNNFNIFNNNNNNKLLNNNKYNNNNNNNNIPLNPRIINISAGKSHFLALTDSGLVIGWGINSFYFILFLFLFNLFIY